jgi:hypothetical protein
MKNGVFRNNPQNPIAAYSTRAALLANIPDSINLTFGNGSYSGSNYVVGAFIQDNWRATGRLTLNLGYATTITPSTLRRLRRVSISLSTISTACLTTNSISGRYETSKAHMTPMVGLTWRRGLVSVGT